MDPTSEKVLGASLPIAEQQLEIAHFTDVGVQVDSKVKAYEQFLNRFGCKDERAEDNRSVEGCSALRRLARGPVRISFEGNVGVGKSTILKLLKSHPRLHKVTEIVQEPLGEWQNVNGSGLNMLEAFYKDPKRYAYLFQSFVFTTRFLQQNAAASKSKATLLLTERSVLTDRCVFVETATEQGYFSPLEAAAYNAWYDGVVTTLPNLVPDAFVYLRADAKVCHNRLKARARSEEAGVSLEYLQSLHTKHEKWFIDGAFKNSGHGQFGGKPQSGFLDSSVKIPAAIHGCPVFVVDCTSNLHFEKPSKDCEAVIDQIVNFLLGPSDSSVSKGK